MQVIEAEYSKVRSALKNLEDDNESFLDSKRKPFSFKKLHERARVHIKKLLISTKHPLQPREI